MGKYIKKFDTHSDYEDFIETEDFIRPNVSYCVDNKDVHYNSTQTLFALEIESGRFISFYFQNGVLYANTDDGSSALWVLDDDGVVVDNISYSIADRAPILAQINEHYGTSFTGWSDNEMGLRYDDIVPNWNAYEKIEIIMFTDNEWYLIRFEAEKYIGVLAYEDEDTYSLGVNTTGGETPEPIMYNKNRERIGINNISDEQYEIMTEKLMEYNGQSVYFEENPSYSVIPNSAKIINI